MRGANSSAAARSYWASALTALPPTSSFKQKFDLQFTLLADPDHAVAEAYGVWVEKSMYGKKYMGVERSTFVIGADGNLVDVMRKVKPETHADEVLAALGS